MLDYSSVPHIRYHRRFLALDVTLLVPEWASIAFVSASFLISCSDLTTTDLFSLRLKQQRYRPSQLVLSLTRLSHCIRNKSLRYVFYSKMFNSRVVLAAG